MRGYCIYIGGLPSSLATAMRCVRSGTSHGVDISLFHGTDRFEAIGQAAKFGISPHGFDYVESMAPKALRDAQLGCFLSHYRLWLRCAEGGEPIRIFEDDAIVNAPIPHPDFEEVLNLQDSIWNDPNWRFHRKVMRRLLDRTATRPAGGAGVVPAKFICLPSTCAYSITPAGATKLIAAAHEHGALPADLFINKKVVDIRDLLPFPASSDHQFSAVKPNADWSGFLAPESGSDERGCR